jgi:trans-aconitate methyltransferase
MIARRGEPSQQWDARGYNQAFAFVWEHGASLVDLLDPQPGERVLDLGCGTGHLTAEIAGRGAVAIGIDSSAEMVESARAAYPDIEFFVADAANFSLPDPVDAVFSNAVLHWVHPPEGAVRSVRGALKPGGRLVAELGGHGNVAAVVSALTGALQRHGFADAAAQNPWYFPSIGEYATLIESYDMEPVLMQLYDRPTLLDGGEAGLSGWLRMFAGSFLGRVPDERHADIVADVERALRPGFLRDGSWWADYRRLRVIARRRH